LRTRIFPWLESAQLPSNDDEFTIKSVSSGYVSHAFTFIIHQQFRKKNYPYEFFIKINKNSDAKEMFDAEAFGLQSLQSIYKTFVRIPQIYATGYLSENDHNQGAWFLSEFVSMSNTANKRSDRQNHQFAQILSQMHRTSAEQHAQSTYANQFGFDRNNFYVHTQQDNTWRNNWCEFFIEQRFKPIIQRMKTDPSLVDHLEKNIELILLCERLLPHIPFILSSSSSNQMQFRPCLLHGDLSTQNWSVNKNGQIVLFDASPFYGPYEFDIFTMPKVFIDAYFDAIGGPTDGYEMRMELYTFQQKLRSIIDAELDIWRPNAYKIIQKLLITCGAWTSPLVRFPCGIKTPVDKILFPTELNTQKKNAVLIYGGSFCPIHLNHLDVMNTVAETLEKSPYNYHIIGGYFAPSAESWIKKKLPNDYLPAIYRECLIMLTAEGTRWMIERSYRSPEIISNYILKAISTHFGDDLDITLIHVCGIDAIANNDTRVPIEYPLVVIDRSGYDGENQWNQHFQMVNQENRDRLIWISPWTGQTRSSTMIRQLLNQLHTNETLERLQNFLPLSCIEFIFEYELKKYFKSNSTDC